MTVLAVPADLEVARPPCERYDAASATYTSDTVPAQARTQLASALDLGGPRCATRAVQQLTGLAITRYVGFDLARLGDAVNALSGVSVLHPAGGGRRDARPGRPDAGHGQPRRQARPPTSPGPRPSRATPPPDAAASNASSRCWPPSSTRRCPTPACSTCAAWPRCARRSATPSPPTPPTSTRSSPSPAHCATSAATGVTFTAVPTDPDPADQGSVLRARRGGRAVRRAAHRRPAARRPRRAPPPARGRRTSPCRWRTPPTAPGVAGKVADTLRGLGFRIGDVTNAAQPTPQTLIRYSPDQTAAAQLLATTVPAATTVPDPGATGVLQLVLGRSFDGVVRAPDDHARRISRTAAPRPRPPPRAAPDGRRGVHLRFSCRSVWIGGGRLPSVHARRLSGPTRRAGLEPRGHVRGRSPKRWPRPPGRCWRAICTWPKK